MAEPCLWVGESACEGPQAPTEGRSPSGEGRLADTEERRIILPRATVEMPIDSGRFYVLRRSWACDSRARCWLRLYCRHCLRPKESVKKA